MVSRRRQGITWARQQQEQELDRRRLRAELRTALRRLAQEPEEFETVMQAASRYAQLREYENALFLLGEGERLRPDSPEVFRAKGEAYLSSGQYDRCVEALERGLRLAPDDMELNLLRVDIDAILGWVSDSRPRMKRLLQQYGDREARVHIMAALLARQVADPKESEARLRDALRLDPKNDKVYALLSGLEWELGHREPALDLIRKAIALNPRHADYYVHLGEILGRGVERTPRADAKEERARLMELAETEQVYRTALDLNPASHQAKHGYAICRVSRGDPEGQRMLEELLKLNPFLPAPMRELADLFRRQGRHQEAAALDTRYARSIEESNALKGLSLRMAMQPGNASTYLEMGQLHLRTGYPQKAIVVLRRALRLNPRLGEARRALAEAAAAAGRAPEIEAFLAKP